jgi:hypothetical protein
MHHEPPGWLSTEDLERELLLAVIGESSAPEQTTNSSESTPTSQQTNRRTRSSIAVLCCGCWPTSGRKSRSCSAADAKCEYPARDRLTRIR